MNIKINKKIGLNTMQIEIDEKNDKEALAKALVYVQPDYCGLCKGQNVIWDSNKAKDKKSGGTFTYIKRKCLNKDCLATSTLGEYKDGGYFWKPFEIYNKEERQGGGTQNNDEI